MHTPLNTHDDERWGLILAGGQGRRLRTLTRAVVGDERPKQFCPLLGPETLLERTRRRAALAIPPARNLVALTRDHEHFYRPLVGGMPAHCTVIQPLDKGTAPAILYGLMRIAAFAPTSAVAIFPSDHYVGDDRVFMNHVTAAFTAVRMRPELVVLLGIAPASAETDYGWIEPAEPVAGTPLLRVRRFWEKPAEELAETLFARGYFWNSFVMVARIPAFLAMIRHAAPALEAAFGAVGATLGTPAESAAVQKVYARLTPSSFSDVVLASRPSNLAVLPVTGVKWSDWGRPSRVMATLAELGIRPEWADHVATTA
jgi:mannose-1-phosphate guanylyltransferase